MIFVVGMPRSGTTLLARLLDAHPEIDVTPETFYFQRAAEALSTKQLISSSAIQSAFLKLVSQWHTDPRNLLVEKTPMHIEYLPVIRKAIPGARVIFLVRDPRAVVASLKHVPWNRRGVAANASRWSCYLEIVLSASQENDLVIRYEDLVLNAGSCLHQLQMWCGVTPRSIDSEFFSRTTRIYAATQEPWKAGTEQAINQRSLAKWKQELKRVEISAIEALCGTGMKRFRYEPMFVNSRSSAHNRFVAFAHRIRFERRQRKTALLAGRIALEP